MNTGKTIILLLTLAAAGQVGASELATPLPELSQNSWASVGIMLTVVIAAIGFVGLLVASAQKVDLHYGMGDVYLSVPIALGCWLGLGGLMFMFSRGDDLLPYLQDKLWMAGGLLAVSLALSFVLVKRCNPDSGFFGLIFATFGRLFADTLSQLLSVLIILCGLWVIFGGRKQNGEKVSFMGRLGCTFAFVWMFNLVWGSIRTTTREPVSAANGYLLAILNMLCVAGALYAGYEYTHRLPVASTSALVEAVRSGDSERALDIIANNPMLDRTPAIEVALREGRNSMLNHIIRDKSDLEDAMLHAETHGLQRMDGFLKSKYMKSFPQGESPSAEEKAEAVKVAASAIVG